MVRAGCAACGGFTTPEEIMELICSHLRVDGSLACDSDQQLYVEIEPLADNCTVRGPSGGIYTPCNSAPPGIRCRRTIEGLPDFVTIGNTGGSGLTHAYASPQAIEYAIDNRVDMISNITWSLVGDLVSAWGPYYGDMATSFYTTDQADGVSGWTVYASEWSQLLSDAGTTESPTGRSSTAPAGQKTPDGGWYGFHAPQYRLLTTQQVLAQVDGRAVVRVQCANGNPYGGVERDVAAAMRAINIMCAQDYAMIMVGVSDIDQIPVIEGDNIRSMLFTNQSLTPDEIVDTGTQWVQTGHEAPDEFITSLVDAGLNVILDTNARQNQTQRAMDLGCRGVASSDPVYHRGPVNPPDTYGYRRTTNNYIRGFTSVGHLTQDTDAGGGIAARGYHREDAAGLYFRVPGEDTRIDCLMGNISPISDTEAYTLTARVQVDQGSLPAHGGTGLGPRAGVIFACDTDVSPDDDSTERTGYWGIVTVSDSDSGTLILGMYDDTGASVQLAEASGPAVPPNAWIDMTVTVAGGTITLTRSDVENYSVSADDSTWRGEYFHVHAANSSGADPEWYVGFADVSGPDIEPVLPGDSDGGQEPQPAPEDVARDDAGVAGSAPDTVAPARDMGKVSRARRR